MYLPVLQQMKRRRFLPDIGPSEHCLYAQFLLVGTSHQSTVARLYRAGPERGRHAIVVALGNRIELVIVTPRTLYRDSKKGRTHHIHHVLQSLVLVILRVIRFVIPCPGPQHAGCNQRLPGSFRQLIARQLLTNEPVVGHVLIERLDHPVTILPDVWLHCITLVAIGLRVAHHVEPVPGPALSEVPGSQKSINQRRVGTL